MSRFIPWLALLAGLVGCMTERNHHPRPLPPPYGAVAPTASATAASSSPKPVGPAPGAATISGPPGPAQPVANHSPLTLTVADAAPEPTSPEPALIPPKPAGSTTPTPPAPPSAAAPLEPEPTAELGQDPSTLASALPWRPRRPRAEPPGPLAPTPPASPPAPAAPRPSAPIPPVPPRASSGPQDPASPIPPSSSGPAGSSSPTNQQNLKSIKELLAKSAAAWEALTTYEATLTRRELNPKGQWNNEVVLLQFRRDPLSVYSRNIGETGQGREVVYNPSQHGDKLHIKLGAGDNRLLKAGTVLHLSPDDPKVTEKMRYSIREAGFGRMIQTLQMVVAQVEAGKLPAEVLSYQGEVSRKDYPHPLIGVTHQLRPGDDPLMPTGGTRQYFFDGKPGSPGYSLPVLVVATDPKGREVEYYRFENLRSPARLTDADFHPARLQPK